MVNTINLSSYPGSPPLSENADRKISGGSPLYGKQLVNTLLNQGESVIRPWTRKCISDLKKYSFDNSDVVDLLQCVLATGVFKGAEWCVAKPGGAWAACDSYQVLRGEWVEYAHKNMQVEYYVKFAVGKQGHLSLMVSCHLSENR
jgi:hypothetical protein